MSQLAFLDADLRWRVEAGEVDILVGASSDDLRLADTVTLTSDALIDGASRAFYASPRIIARRKADPRPRPSTRGCPAPDSLTAHRNRAHRGDTALAVSTIRWRGDI